MKRQIITVLLVSAVTVISGCASMCDAIIDCELEARNHILSQKAWGHWSWCYDNLDYPYHFAKGFKAGYRDVLDGGNGCQPALPPRQYWKPCYNTPEGKCKTHAWFDGFSHGALAAKQDGYGSFGGIPVSPRVKQNLMMSRKRPEHNMLFQELEPTRDGGLESESGGSMTQPLLPTPQKDPETPEGAQNSEQDKPRSYDE